MVVSTAYQLSLREFLPTPTSGNANWFARWRGPTTPFRCWRNKAVNALLVFS